MFFLKNEKVLCIFLIYLNNDKRKKKKKKNMKVNLNLAGY